MSTVCMVKPKMDPEVYSVWGKVGWDAGTCEKAGAPNLLFECQDSDTHHPDDGIAYQLPRDQADPRFVLWGSYVHPNVTRWPAQPADSGKGCGVSVDDGKSMMMWHGK